MNPITYLNLLCYPCHSVIDITRTHLNTRHWRRKRQTSLFSLFQDIWKSREQIFCFMCFNTVQIKPKSNCQEILSIEEGDILTNWHVHDACECIRTIRMCRMTKQKKLFWETQHIFLKAEGSRIKNITFWELFSFSSLSSLLPWVFLAIIFFFFWSSL